MKALILTEGGRKAGYGHIIRCLALYRAFEGIGVKPEIIVYGDDSVKGILKSRRYKIQNWLKDRTEVFKAASGADIVLVDSYNARLGFYKKISGIAKLPVYIDDNRRIDYPTGVVVNSAVYAGNIGYPKKKGVFYLLGIGYALLREEFSEVSQKRIREHVKNALVTFGGSDPQNVAPKVLRLLSHAYPRMNKHVVIGKGFIHTDELERYKDKKTRFIYDPGAHAMKELMSKSDIAVSAGGQTLYELARTGTPSIVITVAENQIRNSRALSSAGVVEHAGCYFGGKGRNDKTMKRLKTILEKVLSDSKLRSKMSRMGKKMVDGRGAARTVKGILKYMKSNGGVTRYA